MRLDLFIIFYTVVSWPKHYYILNLRKYINVSSDLDISKSSSSFQILTTRSYPHHFHSIISFMEWDLSLAATHSCSGNLALCLSDTSQINILYKWLDCRWIASGHPLKKTWRSSERSELNCQKATKSSETTYYFGLAFFGLHVNFPCEASFKCIEHIKTLQKSSSLIIL